MKNLTHRIGALCTAAVLLICAAALVCHPREISQAVCQGLRLGGTVLLPALFPFFVLTSLVISLGLARFWGRLLAPVMGALFHLDGSCALPLALGLLGGYPVGARAALDLYRAGQCRKEEAERLLAFCSNAGPSFILGVAGARCFGDTRAGLLLWLTHIAAALLVGLLLRRPRPAGAGRGPSGHTSIAAVSLPAAFTRAVTDGLSASLNLCAFVICFSVILRLCGLTGLLPALARLLGRLGLPQPWAEVLLTGLLELSTGMDALRGSGDTALRLTLAALFLGWGGLSVHCQTLSLLTGSGLSCRWYWCGKLLQGLIAAGLTALACPLLAPSCSAALRTGPAGLLLPLLAPALLCVKNTGKPGNPVV